MGDVETTGHRQRVAVVEIPLEERIRIILAQDAIWMEENLEGYVAGLNYSILDWTDSVERLKMMRDVEKAPLWFGHSMKQYESMGEKWYK